MNEQIQAIYNYFLKNGGMKISQEEFANKMNTYRFRNDVFKTLKDEKYLDSTADFADFTTKIKAQPAPAQQQSAPATTQTVQTTQSTPVETAPVEAPIETAATLSSAESTVDNSLLGDPSVQQVNDSTGALQAPLLQAEEAPVDPNLEPKQALPTDVIGNLPTEAESKREFLERHKTEMLQNMYELNYEQNPLLSKFYKREFLTEDKIPQNYTKEQFDLETSIEERMVNSVNATNWNNPLSSEGNENFYKIGVARIESIENVKSGDVPDLGLEEDVTFRMRDDVWQGISNQLDKQGYSVTEKRNFKEKLEQRAQEEYVLKRNNKLISETDGLEDLIKTDIRLNQIDPTSIEDRTARNEQSLKNEFALLEKWTPVYEEYLKKYHPEGYNRIQEDKAKISNEKGITSEAMRTQLEYRKQRLDAEVLDFSSKIMMDYLKDKTKGANLDAVARESEWLNTSLDTLREKEVELKNDPSNKGLQEEITVLSTEIRDRAVSLKDNTGLSAEDFDTVTSVYSNLEKSMDERNSMNTKAFFRYPNAWANDLQREINQKDMDDRYNRDMAGDNLTPTKVINYAYWNVGKPLYWSFARSASNLASGLVKSTADVFGGDKTYDFADAISDFTEHTIGSNSQYAYALTPKELQSMFTENGFNSKAIVSQMSTGLGSVAYYATLGRLGMAAGATKVGGLSVTASQGANAAVLTGAFFDSYNSMYTEFNNGAPSTMGKEEIGDMAEKLSLAVAAVELLVPDHKIGSAFKKELTKAAVRSLADGETKIAVSSLVRTALNRTVSGLKEGGEEGLQSLVETLGRGVIDADKGTSFGNEINPIEIAESFAIGAMTGMITGGGASTNSRHQSEIMYMAATQPDAFQKILSKSGLSDKNKEKVNSMIESYKPFTMIVPEGADFDSAHKIASYSMVISALRDKAKVIEAIPGAEKALAATNKKIEEYSKELDKLFDESTKKKPKANAGPYVSQKQKEADTDIAKNQPKGKVVTSVKEGSIVSPSNGVVWDVTAKTSDGKWVVSSTHKGETKKIYVKEEVMDKMISNGQMSMVSKEQWRKTNNARPKPVVAAPVNTEEVSAPVSSSAPAPAAPTVTTPEITTTETAPVSTPAAPKPTTKAAPVAKPKRESVVKAGDTYVSKKGGTWVATKKNVKKQWVFEKRSPSGKKITRVFTDPQVKKMMSTGEWTVQSQQPVVEKQTESTPAVTQQSEVTTVTTVTTTENKSSKSSTNKSLEKKETPISERSDEDIETRMSEIETSKDKNDQAEFNTLEKEMEKREWDSIFTAPLNKVKSVVDKLMKKEKEMPNGFGAFLDKKDAKELKRIAEKYSDPSGITDEQIIKDFKKAIWGNIDTWASDGLLLREVMKEAASRGISDKSLYEVIEKEFTEGLAEESDIRDAKANAVKFITGRFEKLLNKNRTKNENVGESTIESNSTQIGDESKKEIAPTDKKEETKPAEEKKQETKKESVKKSPAPKQQESKPAQKKEPVQKKDKAEKAKPAEKVKETTKEKLSKAVSAFFMAQNEPSTSTQYMRAKKMMDRVVKELVTESGLTNEQAIEIAQKLNFKKVSTVQGLAIQLAKNKDTYSEEMIHDILSGKDVAIEATTDLKMDKKERKGGRSRMVLEDSIEAAKGESDRRMTLGLGDKVNKAIKLAIGIIDDADTRTELSNDLESFLIMAEMLRNNEAVNPDEFRAAYAKIHTEGGKYSGLDESTARQKVKTELKNAGVFNVGIAKAKELSKTDDEKSAEKQKKGKENAKFVKDPVVTDADLETMEGVFSLLPQYLKQMIERGSTIMTSTTSKDKTEVKIPSNKLKQIQNIAKMIAKLSTLSDKSDVTRMVRDIPGRIKNLSLNYMEGKSKEEIDSMEDIQLKLSNAFKETAAKQIDAVKKYDMAIEHEEMLKSKLTGFDSSFSQFDFGFGANAAYVAMIGKIIIKAARIIPYARYKTFVQIRKANPNWAGYIAMIAKGYGTTTRNIWSAIKYVATQDRVEMSFGQRAIYIKTLNDLLKKYSTKVDGKTYRIDDIPGLINNIQELAIGNIAIGGTQTTDDVSTVGKNLARVAEMLKSTNDSEQLYGILKKEAHDVTKVQSKANQFAANAKLKSPLREIEQLKKKLREKGKNLDEKRKEVVKFIKEVIDPSNPNATNHSFKMDKRTRKAMSKQDMTKLINAVMKTRTTKSLNKQIATIEKMIINRRYEVAEKIVGSQIGISFSVDKNTGEFVIETAPRSTKLTKAKPGEKSKGQVDPDTQDVFNMLREALLDKNNTMAELTRKIFDLGMKTSLTNEEENELAALDLALMYKNIQSIHTEVKPIMRGGVATGRYTSKKTGGYDSIEQFEDELNKLFSEGRNAILTEQKNRREKLKNDVDRLIQDVDKSKNTSRKKFERFARFNRSKTGYATGRLAEFLSRQHDLDSLLQTISYGNGAVQELIVDRVREMRYNFSNMEVATAQEMKSDLESFFGKNWKSKVRALGNDYFVIEGFKDPQTNMDYRLNHQQLAYWYSLMKNENNHASFEKMFDGGSINGFLAKSVNAINGSIQSIPNSKNHQIDQAVLSEIQSSIDDAIDAEKERINNSLYLSQSEKSDAETRLDDLSNFVQSIPSSGVVSSDMKKDILSMKKTYKTNFITELQAMIQNHVSDEMLEYADHLVDNFYPDYHDKINPVYKRVFGTNLNKESMYAGKIYRSDFDYKASIEHDILSPMQFSNTLPTSGSLKAKENNSTAGIAKMDILTVAATYANEMNYFTAWVEGLRDINAYVNNNKFKNAIKSSTLQGDSINRDIKNQIETLVKRSIRMHDGVMFLNKLTALHSKSTLSGNLSLLPKQFSSVIAGITAINNPTDLKDYMRYNTTGFMSPEMKEARREIVKSAFWKLRYSERFMATFVNEVEGSYKNMTPSLIKEKSDALFNILAMPQKLGDAGAVFLGFSALYAIEKKKALNQGLSVDEAKKKAMLFVSNHIKSTQQSGDTEDKSNLQQKLPFLTTYMSAPLQQWRKESIYAARIIKRMRGSWKGDKSDYGTMGSDIFKLVTYHSVMPVLFEYVASGLPGILKGFDDDDAEDLAFAAIVGNINQLFIIGSMIQKGYEFATDKPYRERSGDLTLDMTMKALKKMYALKDNPSDEEKMDAALAVLDVFGLPATLMGRNAYNLSSLVKGEFKSPQQAILMAFGYSKYITDQAIKDGEFTKPGKAGKVSVAPSRTRRATRTREISSRTSRN